ncbi:MAG TPA: YceI family protein [Myxococcaceae bacterium]|nr:YceI family protein [Myxococcaceae bacterium]
MKLKSLFVAAALAAPSLAFGAAYEIDPAHSAAQFAVKHLMVSTVRGEFDKVSGTVVLDEKDLKSSRIEATIDATTISTRNTKRDEHLRSADFFDVQKFPAITFKSTEVKAAGKDRFKVTGDLTMHGVTRPVVLDVESAATEVKDSYGNVKRGAVATTKLNRKDFGLNWNAALETGGVAVSDEVVVTIDLELNRKDARSAPAK